MDMTPAEQIEQAYNDAISAIEDYLKPGPRNAKETLEKLITILDQDELCEAIKEVLIESRVVANERAKERAQ